MNTENRPLYPWIQRTVPCTHEYREPSPVPIGLNTCVKIVYMV